MGKSYLLKSVEKSVTKDIDQSAFGRKAPCVGKEENITSRVEKITSEYVEVNVYNDDNPNPVSTREVHYEDLSNRVLSEIISISKEQ